MCAKIVLSSPAFGSKAAVSLSAKRAKGNAAALGLNALMDPGGFGSMMMPQMFQMMSQMYQNRQQMIARMTPQQRQMMKDAVLQVAHFLQFYMLESDIDCRYILVLSISVGYTHLIRFHFAVPWPVVSDAGYGI